MTTNPTWTAVDRYLAGTILKEDAQLKAAVQASQDAGLPAIQVSPAHGQLLHLLARSCGAKRILEIGTLGGYSAIWLARALPPNGQLLTLELDPQHATVARANFEQAGVAGRIEIRLGSAIELLPQLAREKPAPFDFCFVDANKDASAEYFDWAVKLSRPGALIIVDNVVRDGAVAAAASQDKLVIGVRRLHESIARDSRVTATTLQTVGEKGYDGLLIAVVN